MIASMISSQLDSKLHGQASLPYHIIIDRQTLKRV